MKHTLTLFITILCMFSTGTIMSQSYFGVQPPGSGDSSLLVIDIGTGMVMSSTPVVIPGTPIDGYTGMARNPVDGVIYVVLRSAGTFKLATIEADGTATFIADLSDKFASITFDAGGTLYGITGDGATTPSTIFSINTTTGLATIQLAPPGGSDGEAIAFNTDNGLLYRYAGGGIFQSINILTNLTTQIDSLPNIDNFAHALYYNSAGGDFTFSAGDTIYQLTTAGVPTILSSTMLSDGLKGLIEVQGCSPQTVSVSQNASTLTADSTAEGYQWVDCDNNYAALAGETGQSFTATANGNFALVATSAGCSDTSACTSVTGVGINEPALADFVSIYPNPASDVLHIELQGLHGSVSIEIYDLIGNQKLVQEFDRGQKLTVATGDYVQGIYFLKVRFENEIASFKLTIK